MTKKSRILDKLLTAFFVIFCTIIGNWIYDYLKKENPPFINVIFKIYHSISSDWRWASAVLLIFFFIIFILFFKEIKGVHKKHTEVSYIIVFILGVIVAFFIGYKIGIIRYLVEYQLYIAILLYIPVVCYNVREYLRARREGLDISFIRIILLILGSFPLFVDLLRPKKMD